MQAQLRASVKNILCCTRPFGREQIFYLGGVEPGPEVLA
jgi:hypothetical protein